MSFDNQYSLKLDEVVIKHAGDKYLRIDPDNEDNLDSEGGKGKYARFYVEKLGEGVVQLKSKHTGKYVRIVGEGEEINSSGGGGKFTPFKVHDLGDGVVKLESQAYEGKYISVFDGTVKVGTGGKFCNLQFFCD